MPLGASRRTKNQDGRLGVSRTPRGVAIHEWHILCSTRTECYGTLVRRDIVSV
jgi:hypothetical protein